MKTKSLILILLLAATTLRAQLVADGASLTLNNQTNTLIGDVTVGTNGSFTLLILSDNALLTNSANGIIGLNATARSNEVRLTSATARWVMTLGGLFVGSNGSFNRLVVSNGSQVRSLVGVGSIGRNDGNSNNEAVVTGTGSFLGVPSSALSVGEGGSGNRLVISSGGSVRSGAAHIGLLGSNNEAVVTGTGTGWTNPGAFFVGTFGSRNRLTVTNGGVVSSEGLSVSGAASSTNNRVVVDGGVLLVHNTFGTAALDIRRGTNVLNAGLIEVDQLLLTNAQGFFEFNGGTLITRGAFITNIVPFAVGTFFSKSAVWDVRAGVSNHILTVPLSVGQFSSFSQLLVTNGALLSSAGGFIGDNSNSRSNTATVAGSGSTWSNSAALEIGSAGPFNSMVVSNGGFVHNTSGTVGSFGGNNLALVTGSSSVWSNASDLTVGFASSSNRLVVSDGGTVENNYAFVSFSFDSSNNLATVTGPNAVWRTVNQLNFGYVGPGNQLVVSNGGSVLSDSFALGLSTSRSNTALVTGSGSVLSNASLTFLGENSAGNRLVIANGGEVRSGSTFVGFQSPSSNNAALVTDSGSALNSDVTVGSSGSRNQLVVSNGALAQGSYGAVGVFASGSNNLALVTGSGSVWSNAVELQVGLFSQGNQLVVSNAAKVTAGVGFIGKNANANRNTTLVTGPGTSWLLASNLYVGSNGAFSQLIITNGAFARNEQGFIGAGISSSNNLAVVTGPGSVWSNAGDFFVGSSGAGNQLVVSNGALLASSSNAWLGFSATSRSNAALLTGAGTTWSNGQTFLVGESGSGNRLTVRDGARLESKFGWIGQLTSASNNEVVVTGPDSFWGTEQDLNIGGLGSGNRLVITNGGSVLNNGGAGIGTAMSSSNEVVVTGAGSSWSLGSTLFVGQVASGCRLTISNGGAVFQSSFGGLIVGSVSSSTNNRIQVDGGTLLVTNTVSGKFDVRRGTTVLNAGLIEVSQFLLTNGQGFLQFNGGTFSTRNSRVSHGTLFDIGNGTSPATFILAGNGLHEFTGILAARVSSNATFTGNGTIGGVVPLLFRAGSRLVPGDSVGKMIFSNSPALQGTVVMEISKNGGTLTNDQIQVIAPLTYGGSLVVSNLGPSALNGGDRFPLFSANSYAGGFTNIILPPLPTGLGWTNKLSVDGSIEVVAGPQFTSVTLSGTNVIISGTNGPPNAPYAVLTATNVTEPLSNWLSIVTNLFGPSGEFSFTNGIAPGELQRYFRIRTP